MQISIGCTSEESTASLVSSETQAIYRGDSQHTGAYDQPEIIPGAIRWQFDSEKGLPSVPTVADGTVFIGSYSRYLFAIDSERATLKWRFETGASIITSAAVSDGTVYFGSMDGNLYAVDEETGREIWRFTTEKTRHALPDPTTTQPDSSATPFYVMESEFVRKGLVLSQLEYKVPVRQVLPDHGISSSPVIADGLIYFGTYGKHFYALNCETGEKVWDYQTTGEIPYSPAVSNGTVFFADLTVFLALDAKSGTKKWERPLSSGSGTSPVISGDLVIYDDGQRLSAFRSETGDVVWQFNVKGEVGPDYGAAVKDGLVLHGDETGMRALDLHTGRVIWENSSLGGSTGIPPLIAGSSVYFIDKQAELDTLDLRAGQVKSRFDFQDKFSTKDYWMTDTTMTISDGTIYVASANGHLYAITNQESSG